MYYNTCRGLKLRDLGAEPVIVNSAQEPNGEVVFRRDESPARTGE